MRIARTLGLLVLAALGLMALAAVGAQAKIEKEDHCDTDDGDCGNDIKTELHQILKEITVNFSEINCYVSGQIGAHFLILASIGREVLLTASATNDLRAAEEHIPFSTSTEAIKVQPTDTKTDAHKFLTTSPACSA